MADLRQAAQQALEHVQEFKRRWWQVPAFGNKVNKATREAITNAHSPIFELEHALRAALAEQPAEQEPVATITVNEAMGANFHFTRPQTTLLPGQVLYVYTATQPAKREPLTDEELALSLLETLFDAYENGVPCYEDPETADGYIGHAFLLDDETFHACADLLNRRRPRAHGIGE